MSMKFLEEKYSPFVNDAVKKIVLSKYSAEFLSDMLSKDKHLNNIDIREWDSLAGMRYYWLACYENVVAEWYSHGGSGALKTAVIKKVREAKESWTPATAVCILKAAARLIVKEYREKNNL